MDVSFRVDFFMPANRKSDPSLHPLVSLLLEQLFPSLKELRLQLDEIVVITGGDDVFISF